MLPLILGSTSKYRRELLSRLNLPFQCHAPKVNEDQFKSLGLSGIELAKTLAKEKALAVFKNHPNSVVIGSDQVAAIGDIILDKPGSVERAIEQLMTMQGQDHHLYTAVTLMHPELGEISFCDVTTLSMRALSRAEIERYIKQDMPIDCAGSYKIETLGITLFKNIKSEDFTAITGLPLLLLSQELRKLGYELP